MGMWTTSEGQYVAHWQMILAAFIIGLIGLQPTIYIWVKIIADSVQVWGVDILFDSLQLPH
jgi:hypothetical protein